MKFKTLQHGWMGWLNAIIVSHFFLKSIEKQPAKVNMIAPVPCTGQERLRSESAV